MILDKIVDYTIKRVERLTKLKPYEVVKAEALALGQKNPFAFERALKTQGMAFICEVKKASPSKGIISEDFPYLEIAKEYQKGGAAAISVLTEPEFFMGSDEFLAEIRQAVSIPVLRKDFTISEYQIYEAKTIGADAVLLICSILDTDRLTSYIKIADSLGLSCLVEAHDEDEIKSAISAGARVIGVNNRSLKTFSVDLENSISLRKSVPNEITFISESGIKTREDIIRLEEHDVNAVLIGETLMRSEDRVAELLRLRGGLSDGENKNMRHNKGM